MSDMMKPAGNAIMLLRKLSSKKPRLTPAQIASLKIYNEETDRLFGPVVSKCAIAIKNLEKQELKSSTVAKSTSGANGASQDFSTKVRHPDNGIGTSTTSKNISKLPSNSKRSNSGIPSKEFSPSGSEGFINNQVKSLEFLKYESILLENEKLVLSHILNMPLFNNHNGQSSSDLLWKGMPLPSVSRVIHDSMSEENLMVLARWEKKMIETLGKEGFEKYKLTMFNNGKLLHSRIQHFLEKESIGEIKPEIEGYWNSLQSVLKDIDNVVAIEQMVTNERLHYRGILDCVASYQGRPCLIDWKTSQKPKSSISQTYDQPLQLVAYLSAFNHSLSQGGFDSNISIDHQALENLGLNKDGKVLENCLLVISYENGSQADMHLMNRKTCLKYWSQWVHRLHKYWLDVFLTKHENLNS